MLLRRISYSLLRIHRHALKNPKTWIGVFSGLFVLSLFSAQNIQFFTAIDDIIDQDFKTAPQLAKLKSTFEDHNSLILQIQTRDQKPFTRKELCGLDQWVGNYAFSNPDQVLRVLSPFGVRQALETDRKFWYPKVLDLNCRFGNPDEAIGKLLNQFKDSPFEGSLIPALSLAPNFNGNDLFIELDLAPADPPTKYGAFDTTIVKAVKTDYASGVTATLPNLKTIWGGLADFQFYTLEGYQQVAVLNVVILLVLFLLARFLFGTFKGAGLFSLVLILGTVLLQGVMGALHLPIEVLSNNLFLMVTVSSIEDFLFLGFVFLYQKKSWRRSFRTILVPSFFTSLTTFIGFASLGVSNMGIIRRFGYLVAGGALLEWLLLFAFLPALLQLFPRLRNWANPTKIYWRSGVEKLVKIKFPRRTAWLLLVIFPAAIYGVFHLRYEEIPENTFPQNHVFHEFIRSAFESRGFKSTASIFFESETPREFRRELIAKLKVQPLVAHVEDADDVEDFIYKKVSIESANSFRSELPTSPAFRRWISEQNERRAVVFLRSSETGKVNELRHWVEQQCKDQCFLAGAIISFGEFGERVRDTLLESLWVSLLLIAGVLVFLVQQCGHRDYFAILASAFWGPLAMMVLLWVFQLPIYFVTCLFAATMVGLAGDNAIQYLCSSTTVAPSLAHNLNKMGGASLMVAFAMVVMSLCFLGTYFAPARTLGLLFAGGFILSFIGDFYLLQTWMKKSRSEKLP